jgi:hypothetical protein
MQPVSRRSLLLLLFMCSHPTPPTLFPPTLHGSFHLPFTKAVTQLIRCLLDRTLSPQYLAVVNQLDSPLLLYMLIVLTNFLQRGRWKEPQRVGGKSVAVQHHRLPTGPRPSCQSPDGQNKSKLHVSFLQKHRLCEGPDRCHAPPAHLSVSCPSTRVGGHSPSPATLVSPRPSNPQPATRTLHSAICNP